MNRGALLLLNIFFNFYIIFHWKRNFSPICIIDLGENKLREYIDHVNKGLDAGEHVSKDVGI